MFSFNQAIEDGLPRFASGSRKGEVRWLFGTVVAACALLVGFISLTAIKRYSFTCDYDSIVHPREHATQAPLPRRIFSPASNEILLGEQGRMPNLLEQNGIVGTVTRSHLPSLESRAHVSVPQTIWRTARSRRDTPEFATDLFNSWTKHNPGWDQYFMDDEDIEVFVAAHYNDTVVQAFKEMPLGVMKADVFRYMVIHEYGGVYADMDTECFQPVEHWAPRGCQFVAAVEHNLHFCQWAFAAVPGNGAIGRILGLTMRKMINREYKEFIERGDDFVLAMTGPSVFTEGILDYLGVEERGWDAHLFRLLYKRRKEFRERGVCLLTWYEMQRMLQNRYGHMHPALQKGSWGSWTQAQGSVLKDSKEEEKKED